MKGLLAWWAPFREIATHLGRLVELYELDLEARKVLNPREEPTQAAVFYQDDITISEGERRRLEWIARGGAPLMEGQVPPGPLP